MTELVTDRSDSSKPEAPASGQPRQPAATLKLQAPFYFESSSGGICHRSNSKLNKTKGPPGTVWLGTVKDWEFISTLHFERNSALHSVSVW